MAKEKPAPVDEIPAGGHLNAVIDSVSSDLKRSSDLRSGSHARSGTRRWLLSDHQVTDDIKTMRVSERTLILLGWQLTAAKQAYASLSTTKS